MKNEKLKVGVWEQGINERVKCRKGYRPCSFFHPFSPHPLVDELPLVEGGGLAAAVVGGVEDVPEDDVGDREALTGTGNPNALVVTDIALAPSFGEQLVAFGLGDRGCRSTRRHLGEGGPVELPEGEGLGVAVVEDGVGFGAVGDDDEGGGEE